MSLKNKVVIVTGGSAGIGAAIAEHFAKEGANVAIVGRNEARLNEVAKKCEKHGATVLIVKADVSKDEEAKTVVTKTIEKFGKLDVLVNNAGVFKIATLKSPDLLTVYDDVMKTNVRAVIHLTSLAVPYLEKTKGNIVNITSVLGKTYAQSPQFMVYCTSKAALDHFTRGAAYELGASGIRVNLVSPGPVETDMLATVMESVPQDEKDKTMNVLNRVSVPEEIADVVLFLASDKAKGVTGADYAVDNGVLLL